jgi:DNA helicase-2/ATP-dependent DNA helicase PcrA
MKYTRSQKEAIRSLDKNLQIIACAGSGKTQAVAARVVELLRLPNVKPRNIVAFTFTDKAAAELKDRIATLVEAGLGKINGLAELYVGTIHGYCLDLLQSYLFEFLKYSVLSEIQTRLFISRYSKRSGLADVEIISGPSTGQKLTRKPHDVRIFLDALNALREDQAVMKCVSKTLKGAWDKYDDLLEEHRYLDYSVILVEAVEALLDSQDPERIQVQQEIGDRVKYLIVDEYQDVNPVQETLIRRLHELGANICVVGDDDQSIYQWRGTDINNLLGFQKRYERVQSVTLAENFRSSKGVVESGRLIAEMNQPNRLPKKMAAAGHQTWERGDLLGLSFGNPVEEAKWIAQKILSMRGVPFEDAPGDADRGLSWSDHAVLLRSVRNSAEPIIQAFREQGIPYVVGGFGNLFDADEIKAAVSLFEYIVDEIDEKTLKMRWQNADLGLTAKDLKGGIAVLDRAKTWDRGERWTAYNIQRVYLDFLETVQIKEEKVPPTSAGAARGEIVLYNLGKFSQVISDFEQINFLSEPKQKYENFVWWLHGDAPEHYEEGSESAGFAQPDAVQIMTVHQAKGMEWPVVFLPALQRNRFPSTAGGKGRTKWHILPKAAIPNADRYDGSIEDERRLFYVALTRSKKYLFCSFAPAPDNQLYQRPSSFFQDFIQSPYVLTKEPMKRGLRKLKPRAKRETPNMVLSLSELKYFFECPYQFKLRFLYGFNPPLHEAIGFGKSLHDVLAEVHRRALRGDILGEAQTDELVDRHLHTPFAFAELKTNLRKAAVESIQRYLRRYGPTLAQTEHSEQVVEVQVTPGITVNGRIDLIKRLDTGEVAIVDFKSSERAQAEDVTRAQLNTYAMGYRDLTGKNADLIEVLNLDAKGKSIREQIDEDLITETRENIRKAGAAIRENSFQRLTKWCDTCTKCDFKGICRKPQYLTKAEGGG